MSPSDASPPDIFRVISCKYTDYDESFKACFKNFYLICISGSAATEKLRFEVHLHGLTLDNLTINNNPYFFFLRKEVIQPHLPIRLPCYDFTPVIGPTFGSSLLTVGSLTSGVTNSHGVTGGVYKTRERIHRDILIRDY